VRILAAVTLLLVCISAHADTVVLGSAKDNSLYFDQAGGVSNGKGPTIFAGKNNGGFARRGLIEFDFSGLPSNAVIESVVLELYLPQAQAFATPVSLFRLSSDWGEGASNSGMRGGAGTTAAPGDATWIHTFYQGQFWQTPGGDFAPQASATSLVAGEGASYFWQSTPSLIGDVQDWLANPSTNFGWIILGDEGQGGTAKAFASREYTDTSLRPKLTVVYSAVPEPGLGLASGFVVGLILLSRASRRVKA
jgi:hypothetical protein